MASLPLAEISDLEEWLGESLDDETTRAGAVLRAASALVRAEAGRTWIDATTGDLETVPDEVATVVVQVAARAWRNPNGYTQTTVGDVSVGFGRDAATGGVYLTDGERAILARFTTTAIRGLWTLSTTRSDTDLPDIYLDVVASEPIPFLPAGE